jgi:hypothetical protein
MSEVAAPVVGTVAPSLSNRLDACERSGADRFDPVASEFIADLLERAERLGGRARELIEARAAVHLSRLEATHRTACDRARAALDALATHGLGTAATDALHESIETGDPVPALRGARRLLAAGPSPVLPRAASHRRYRDALADLQTALASRRSSVADPQTGLLNGTRLAARILEEAEAISPAWRRSLVASLLDLASLMHLPEVPAPRRRR